MKVKLSIVSFLLVCFAWNASAQDFASNFIKKHGDNEFEVVSIGKQMLSMLEDMSGNNQDIKDAIKGLESIKIITSKAKDKVEKNFKNAWSMLNKKSSGFSEMMSIKEENENIHIMIREEDSIVKDFVLLTSNDSTFNMICLTGEIDMATLGKLASLTQLDKLKKLNSTDKQNGKNKNK